jgi:hypothetical protein
MGSKDDRGDTTPDRTPPYRLVTEERHGYLMRASPGRGRRRTRSASSGRRTRNA